MLNLQKIKNLMKGMGSVDEAEGEASFASLAKSKQSKKKPTTAVSPGKAVRVRSDIESTEQPPDPNSLTVEGEGDIPDTDFTIQLLNNANATTMETNKRKDPP